MNKPKKRSLTSSEEAKSALMPGANLVNTKETSNTNKVNTEDVSSKYIRTTITLHPQVRKALDEYSKDAFINKSQLVTQGLRSVIPEEYFK